MGKSTFAAGGVLRYVEEEEQDCPAVSNDGLNGQRQGEIKRNRVNNVSC